MFYIRLMNFKYCLGCGRTPKELNFLKQIQAALL